jgi:NUMOD4 motif/HNH endonuclease
MSKDNKRTNESDGESLLGEEWRSVVGLERYYEVSNLGRVRPIKRPIRFVAKNGNECFRFIKRPITYGNKGTDGYLRIGLPKICSKDGKRKMRSVARWVAQAFIPTDDPKKTDINHKNYIRTDNRVENLEWVTRSENQKHMWQQPKMDSFRLRLKRQKRCNKTGRIISQC